MVIEEDDFRMELLDDSTKYDLYTIHVVNAKNEEKRREELKLVGYGMSFERCLHYIILHRLSKKKDTYSLKEYLADFKKEVKSLIDAMTSHNVSL